jgi:septal ring factor EnvC (AmiA/AmiB activator)
MVSLLLLSSLFISTLFIFPEPALCAPDYNKELIDIRRKIKEGKKIIKEAKKEEISLLDELKEISRSIKHNSEEIRKYDFQISEMNSKIETVNKEIGSLETDLAERRDLLERRLKNLYKFRRSEIALLLISSKDYSDLIKRSKYMSYIARLNKRIIDDFSSDLKMLDLKRQEVKKLKAELETSKTLLLEKIGELDAQRQKKSALLSSAKKRRSHYEKEIRELTKSSKRLRAMIKRLARLQRSTPSPDKGFSSKKGRLPWPVSGRVIVPFGNYTDPESKIEVYKNGIEIKTATGSTVRAVLGGKVVFADRFKGYGLLLILDHGGGYHSLYGQLSNIFHSTGAIIKKGSAIGSTGRSRTLDVPALYFEIRYKGKPLDPLLWLKK